MQLSQQEITDLTIKATNFRRAQKVFDAARAEIQKAQEELDAAEKAIRDKLEQQVRQACAIEF